MSNNQTDATKTTTSNTEGVGAIINTQDNTNNQENDVNINNRRNERRNQFNSNERNWQGDKPDIGCVLGLRTEWLDKKLSFRSFMEKMVEYVMREFDNANDVLPVVMDQEDPRVDFEIDNMSKELSTEDKNSEVKTIKKKKRK